MKILFLVVKCIYCKKWKIIKFSYEVNIKIKFVEVYIVYF